MKSTRAIFFAATVLIAGFLLIAPGLPVNAQSANDLSGLAGRWQINLSKTKLNRLGPNGKYTPRDATYTYIYSVQGRDVKVDVYEKYPQAAPNRSTTIVTDGKERVCKGDCASVGGVPNDTKVETHAYFKIDSHMFVRLTQVNGKITEYFTTSLATDGKSMTQIIWSPQTPEWENIYVYDKQ